MKIKNVFFTLISAFLLSACGGGSESNTPEQYFTVTASSGSGGSISPSSLSIRGGSTGTFVVTPDEGYLIDYVNGCSGKLNGSKFVTGTISESCAVQAIFKKKSFSVSVIVNGQGSVSKSNAQVLYGDVAEFQLTPATGNGVLKIEGCDGVFDVDRKTFKTSGLKNNCTLVVTFDKEISAEIKGPALTLARSEGKFSLSMIEDAQIDWSIISAPDNSDALINVVDSKNITISSSVGGSYILRAAIKRGYMSKTVDLPFKIATVISEDIRENTVLTLAKSPYFLTKSIFIDKDVRLTSEPGIEIYSYSQGITVYGVMDIRGKEDKKSLLKNIRINPGIPAVSTLTPPTVYIENSIIEDSLIYPPTGYGVIGSVTLKNNVLKNIDSIIYLGSAEANFTKNIFVNCSKAVIQRGNTFIENNVFVSPKESAIENWGGGTDKTVTIKNNSFYNNGGVVIRVQSSAMLDASHNYWGTTDENIIRGMIFDSNDDPSIRYQINYTPFLTQPHPDTPVYTTN